MIHFQARLKVPRVDEFINGEKLAKKIIEIANNC